jgi:hypothetical protein
LLPPELPVPPAAGLGPPCVSGFAGTPAAAPPEDVRPDPSVAPDDAPLLDPWPPVAPVEPEDEPVDCARAGKERAVEKATAQAVTTSRFLMTSSWRKGIGSGRAHPNRMRRMGQATHVPCVLDDDVLTCEDSGQTQGAIRMAEGREGVYKGRRRRPMRTSVHALIATITLEHLGPGSSNEDRSAYGAYLAARLPGEVEADEVKYFFEDVWNEAIRDWAGLIGPFYKQ